MSIYQVVVKGLLQSSGALRNITHYTFPDYDPDSTEKQAFVDEFDSKFKNRLRAHFHPNVQVASYGLRRVDTGNLPEEQIVPTAGAWVGTSAGNQLPEMNCVMVTWKAAAAFPRSQRSYLFPMSVGAVTADGGVLAAVLTNANLWGTDARTIVVTGAASALKVAVQYSGTPRVVTSFNVVTSSATAGRWRTQRARRLGVGE